MEKLFERTVDDYIGIILSEDHNGELEVWVEAILDEDGDAVDWTENKFHELPVLDQLERCVEFNNMSCASITKWVVAE